MGYDKHKEATPQYMCAIKFKIKISELIWDWQHLW